jgi:hypothetical protein
MSIFAGRDVRVTRNARAVRHAEESWNTPVRAGGAMKRRLAVRVLGTVGWLMATAPEPGWATGMATATVGAAAPTVFIHPRSESTADSQVVYEPTL